MSRKKTEINPERAENLKKLIEKENITQSHFADIVGYTQQSISSIINLKNPLTEELARLIVNKFPEYRVEWLLGYDDIPTVNDFEKNYIEMKDSVNKATLMVLEAALHEISLREGIEIDHPLYTPDIMLLQAQLQDFADSLMWNYLKHREHSHFWNCLDQLISR